MDYKEWRLKTISLVSGKFCSWSEENTREMESDFRRGFRRGRTPEEMAEIAWEQNLAPFYPPEQRRTY